MICDETGNSLGSVHLAENACVLDVKKAICKDLTYLEPLEQRLFANDSELADSDALPTAPLNATGKLELKLLVQQVSAGTHFDASETAVKEDELDKFAKKRSKKNKPFKFKNFDETMMHLQKNNIQWEHEDGVLVVIGSHSSGSDRRRVWTVSGGKTTGGLLVRRDKSIKSEPYESKLSTGATVQELHIEGSRLHYLMICGDGPESGWVSTSTSDGLALMKLVESTA